jgi:hypothetical protein
MVRDFPVEQFIQTEHVNENTGVLRTMKWASTWVTMAALRETSGATAGAREDASPIDEEN